VLYKFDSFELDRSQYRLSREQTTIHVKPRVFELLVYLLEHRDRVVKKEELLSTLWEGRFVSEGVLAEAVHEARRALGEDAEQAAFIKTVHGRGYQFVFRPVQVIAGQNESAGVEGGSFCMHWTGGPTPLRDGENFIGRDPACLIVLIGLRVSRQHARIVVTSTTAIVEDLGSKNGTLVNGRKISAPVSLSEGDVIEIGGFPLTFRNLRSDLSTMTQGGSSSRS
jgi:DNA-binding winged helix-turn-helix (wHTH) protein